MKVRPNSRTHDPDRRAYEAPRVIELGPVSKLTLIGKQGSLADGIHIARLGGTLHQSSA